RLGGSGTRTGGAAPSETASIHAQSARSTTAPAAIKQPHRKPMSSTADLLRRVRSSVANGRLKTASIDSRTKFVRLPVMTAVDTAPGTDSRRSAYWQAIAATASSAATPGDVLGGAGEGLVKPLKTNVAVSSAN